MEQGKQMCELLKKLRKAIAVDNNIKYDYSECNYKGECQGTCPKCDAELEELQKIIDEKECSGETIVFSDETKAILNDVEYVQAESHILRGSVCAPIDIELPPAPSEINIVI